MRRTAVLLMLCSSAPAGMAQAAIEAATTPHIRVPAISVPQLLAPAVTTPRTAAPAASRSHAISKQFHHNVVTLIGLTGLRRELLSNRETLVQQSKQEILRRFPSYDPAFADEAARRMEQRMSVDGFVDVVVAVYEKNFTNQDVVEMIRIKKDVMASKTPVISPRLQAKLSTAAVTVHDEIIRGFAERGYKLGGQIGQEIAKEHPEWLNGSETFSPVNPVGSINQVNSISTAFSITPADSVSSPNFVVTPAN
jgi:hypothetical protein